jgi:hypothetical protein
LHDLKRHVKKMMAKEISSENMKRKKKQGNLVQEKKNEGGVKVK